MDSRVYVDEARLRRSLQHSLHPQCDGDDYKTEQPVQMRCDPDRYAFACCMMRRFRYATPQVVPGRTGIIIFPPRRAFSRAVRSSCAGVACSSCLCSFSVFSSPSS
jgi:hypothetical protein